MGGKNNRGSRISSELWRAKVQKQNYLPTQQLVEDANALESERGYLLKTAGDPERLQQVENQLRKLKEIAEIIQEAESIAGGEKVNEDRTNSQVAE